MSATLELTVWNITIPLHTKLLSWFGLSESGIADYHRATSVSWTNREVLWNSYLKSFSEHRLAPPNPAAHHNFGATLDRAANGTEYWTFRWADFDANVDLFFGDSPNSYGFTMHQISLKGMGSGTFYDRTIGTIGTHEWGTPEHTRLFNSYAGTVEQHLAELGMLEKTMVYWFDEPEPKDYDFVKEGMKAIHVAAPRLKRFLTEEYVANLSGFVDIWGPV
jgi:hypothetical protein